MAHLPSRCRSTDPRSGAPGDGPLLEPGRAGRKSRHRKADTGSRSPSPAIRTAVTDFTKSGAPAARRGKRVARRGERASRARGARWTRRWPRSCDRRPPGRAWRSLLHEGLDPRSPRSTAARRQVKKQGCMIVLIGCPCRSRPPREGVDDQNSIFLSTIWRCTSMGRRSQIRPAVREFRRNVAPGLAKSRILILSSSPNWWQRRSRPHR